jgi:hypothetical protein
MSSSCNTHEDVRKPEKKWVYVQHEHRLKCVKINVENRMWMCDLDSNDSWFYTLMYRNFKFWKRERIFWPSGRQSVSQKGTIAQINLQLLCYKCNFHISSIFILDAMSIYLLMMKESMSILYFIVQIQVLFISNDWCLQFFETIRCPYFRVSCYWHLYKRVTKVRFPAQIYLLIPRSEVHLTSNSKSAWCCFPRKKHKSMHLITSHQCRLKYEEADHEPAYAVSL